MNTWLYNLGSWNPIAERIDFDQLEKQGLGWSEAIEHSGYERMGSSDESGLDPFFFFDLYRGHGGYLASIAFGGNGGPDEPNVYIDDFLSLMCWLKEFGPVAAQYSISAWIGYKGDEIHEIIRKQFQATHGHSPDSSCWDCDPRMMEIIRDRKLKAEQRIKGNKNAQ